MRVDRFVEFVREEDESLTSVVKRPDGSRYELRNCRITSVTEEVCDPNSREIPIIWTRVR